MKLSDRQVRSPVMWAVLAVLIAIVLALVIFNLGNGTGAGAGEPGPAPSSSTFTDQGSPVPVPAEGMTMSTAVTSGSGTVSFTDQGTKATASQLSTLSTTCTGTYWYWQPAPTGVYEYIPGLGYRWWYQFGPTMYWCTKGGVVKDVQWVNRLNNYGGVYNYVDHSKWVSQPGYESRQVVDVWVYKWGCCGVYDTRRPSYNFWVHANGGVNGTVYFDH